MKKIFLIIAVLVGISTLLSCKKDKEEPLLMTINPDYLVINATGGQNQSFTIRASGPASLSRFFVQVQDNSNIRTFLLDSTLVTGKEFTLLYSYAVPKRSTYSVITLFFTVTDADGNVITSSRTLNVLTAATAPVEATSLKIYTNASGNADAYDLLNMASLQSSSSPAAELDIKDVPNTTDANQVSYSWTSGSGAKFVRYDAFNYGTATKEQIEAAYKSGIALSQINSLEAGAVLIAETNRDGIKRYYAISIISINEDATGTNDFYLFSVKY